MRRLRVNNQIRIPQVHVIDEKGKSLGVMETHKALNLAQAKGLDLVEVNPTARPSIARLMDYGKYLYQKTKTERKRYSKLRAGELKGVRFRYGTDKHDLEIKAARIDKFLKKGYKVRIEMFLRGREKAHPEIIQERLKNFLGLITEPYRIEQGPKKYPRGLNLIIVRENK